MFSEVFNTAPPLPRPLVSRHRLRFITGAGLLQESLSVAPMNKEEEDKVVFHLWHTLHLLFFDTGAPKCMLRIVIAEYHIKYHAIFHLKTNITFRERKKTGPLSQGHHLNFTDGGTANQVELGLDHVRAYDYDDEYTRITKRLCIYLRKVGPKICDINEIRASALH